jgi:negative regulator of flagellin synthesis FlgM
MKIQNYRSSSIHLYQKQLDQQKLTKKRSQEDKIEISTQAKELQRMSEIELERQEKVQKMIEQVESGAYAIDAKEIAKSLIQFYRKQ